MVVAILAAIIYFRRRKASTRRISLLSISTEHPSQGVEGQPMGESSYIQPFPLSSARNLDREKNPCSERSQHDAKIRNEYSHGHRSMPSEGSGSQYLISPVTDSSRQISTQVMSESGTTDRETSHISLSGPEDPTAIPELLQRLNRAIANLPHGGLQEGEGDDPPEYFAR